MSFEVHVLTFFEALFQFFQVETVLFVGPGVGEREVVRSGVFEAKAHAELRIDTVFLECDRVEGAEVVLVLRADHGLEPLLELSELALDVLDRDEQGLRLGALRAEVEPALVALLVGRAGAVRGDPDRDLRYIRTWFTSLSSARAMLPESKSESKVADPSSKRVYWGCINNITFK